MIVIKSSESSVARNREGPVGAGTEIEAPHAGGGGDSELGVAEAALVGLFARGVNAGWLRGRNAGAAVRGASEAGREIDEGSSSASSNNRIISSHIRLIATLEVRPLSGEWAEWLANNNRAKWRVITSTDTLPASSRHAAHLALKQQMLAKRQLERRYYYLTT